MKTLNYATPCCDFNTYYWNQPREAITDEGDATHMILTDTNLDCVELDFVFHHAHNEIRDEEAAVNNRRHQASR